MYSTDLPPQSMFAMPDYQKSTVNGYIKSLNGLYKHRYNQAGRGYPDVSAQSEELSLVQGGTNYGVSGTSGAAPIFVRLSRPLRRLN